MTLEEILNEWGTDAPILEYNIANASLETHKLHHKYWKMLSHERIRKQKKKAELSMLRKLKSEYYTGTLDINTMKEKGWKPFRLKILKSELQFYMDSDEELIQFDFSLAIMTEKVELLDSIVKSIMTRNFTISNHINYIRYREASK